jgi:PTH2 family peptidyl-tRNA hydrolase
MSAWTALLRRANSHTGERMVILVNSNANMSRGKFAAQAVHAALLLHGVHHGGPVIVLGGKPGEIADMPTVVHDAGRTEVEPGTLTAGARWESR